MNTNNVISLPVSPASLAVTGSDGSTDLLFTTAVPHGLRAGDAVTFTGTTAPGNITLSTTTYYVAATELTATTFNVSTTMANVVSGTVVSYSSTGGAGVYVVLPGGLPTDLSASDHKAVVLRRTGLTLATSVNDRVIGTIMVGNRSQSFSESTAGRAVDVLLSTGFTHFVVLGAGVTTAIYRGDELQLDTTDGTYSLRTTGTTAAIAIDEAPASSTAGIIRALVLPPRRTIENTEVVTAARVFTAEDSGTTFFLDNATGFTCYLPPMAAGLNFTFINKTTLSSGNHVVTAAVADKIAGYPLNSGGADSVADGNAAGDVVNFIQGSVPGDWYKLSCDGAFWYATGVAKAINTLTITG